MQNESQIRSERRVLIAGIIGYAVLTALTALLAPSIVERFYPLPPDQGSAWYYWQLPVVSTLARITYWSSYAVHQVVIWLVLFKAMKRATASHRATGESRMGGPFKGSVKLNSLAMGLNLAFVALHLVQTYFWYDGLAQDVPIWTSQGSVIAMLMIILYMEIPYRGLLWGRRFNPPEAMLSFLRRFHGIYIAWALTYTFWFHPMDGNWGLLSGFVYMFLLFIQLSMFNTRLHMNRAWVVLLEWAVVVHATLITVYKDNPIWPMFMFGFLVMFVLTQMHELPWARRLRWPLTAVFVAAVAGVYGFVRGVEHLYEITFIPVALYGGVLALLLIGWLIERIPVVQTRLKA